MSAQVITQAESWFTRFTETETVCKLHHIRLSGPVLCRLKKDNSNAVATTAAIVIAFYNEKMHLCERVIDFSLTPLVLGILISHALLDLIKMQYQVGHTDPSVTLRFYSHVVENRPENTNDKVAKTFSDGLGSGSAFRFW